MAKSIETINNNCWIITLGGMPMRFYGEKQGSGLGFAGSATAFTSYGAAQRIVQFERSGCYAQMAAARADGRENAVVFWSKKAKEYKVIRVNLETGPVSDSMVHRMIQERKAADLRLKKLQEAQRP